LVERGDDKGPARLHVTESLVTALRYLRWWPKTRTLWIDAICLNQSDKTELAQQVPRMGEIYFHAYHGTAWLGVEGADSAHAMATLRYLGQQVIADNDEGTVFCAPDAKEEKWFDPDFELPWDTKAWDSVIALFSRAWFTRLWVVQEIHPGAVLQCGNDTISLTEFSEAEYSLYSKTKLPPGLIPTMTQVDGITSRFWNLVLPRLIYHGAVFKQCEDPRDRIYGHLGLSPPKFVAGMEVSYEKSNTAVDTYKMATVVHADSSKRLEHFHNCFKPSLPRKIGPGPSWVPDFASQPPGETYVPSQFAALNSRCHVRYDPKLAPDVLNVLGVRYGTITSLTTPLPRKLSRWDAIRHVRTWAPADLDTATYAPMNVPLRTAYAITLALFGLREREPDWIVSPVDEWSAQDFPEALFGARATTSENDVQTSEERQDVSDALQCCTERRFFQTNDGFIGLAPAAAQEGDVVAVLLGTPTMILLRPEGSGGDNWQVVGECFVYGLHDAIQMVGHYPEGWRGRAAWTFGGRRVFRFVGPESNRPVMEDPRLGEIKDWERVEDRVLVRDDPTFYDFWINKVTGEEINYDPRMEPEKLTERGVKLTWFSLV
jgi:hypothetical protein